MIDQLVIFDTAKLAKEKGFDELCNSYWCDPCQDNNVVLNTLLEPIQQDDMLLGKAIAPTQSLLQKWLREKHNIHIQLHYDCKYKYWEFRNFILSKYIDKEHNKVYFECIGYNTYEEALEAGLQEALKLI